MGRTALKLLLIGALASPLWAAEPDQSQRVIKRQVYTQPPAGIEEGKVRVIRRVYKKVDPQAPAPAQTQAPQVQLPEPAQPAAAGSAQEKSGYRYFVGAGFGLIMRDRTVVLESKNTGDTLDLGGRSVVADGTSYSLTQDESETAPELELGFYGGDWDYFGGKMTLYGDFVELSVFAGMRFHQVKISGFTPYLQAMAGAGYDGINGLLPDNLTLGLSAGGERKISGDYLSGYAALSYQHRFWQKLQMSYGDEYWRDSEIALRAGVRYAF